MVFIEILKAMFIGIIQGITEWLPVSSTGHMIIANEFVKLNISDGAWELFEVVTQLGSILAVIILIPAAFVGHYYITRGIIPSYTRDALEIYMPKFYADDFDINESPTDSCRYYCFERTYHPLARGDDQCGERA